MVKFLLENTLGACWCGCLRLFYIRNHVFKQEWGLLVLGLWDNIPFCGHLSGYFFKYILGIYYSSLFKCTCPCVSMCWSCDSSMINWQRQHFCPRQGIYNFVAVRCKVRMPEQLDWVDHVSLNHRIWRNETSCACSFSHPFLFWPETWSLTTEFYPSLPLFNFHITHKTTTAWLWSSLRHGPLGF